MAKPVILTGLRANNDLHIGNYFGALLPLIDMAASRADEYDVHLFVPDLHSFTTPIDHKQLQAQIMQNVKVFAAAGLPLDHPGVHVYRQSYVPAHSELTWILDCFTSFGQMRRMTQFKDKSGLQDRKELLADLVQHLHEMKEKFESYSAEDAAGSVDFMLKVADGLEEQLSDQVSVGLFNYPVLMAADILLYGASYVPVGDDQTQHLEFARDIAARLNSQFGDLFVVPKPVKAQHEFFGKDQGLRIRNLQHPTKKMSKSDESDRGVIFLSDTPADAAKKIMSAETDSLGEIQYDYSQQPGISNLLDIYTLLGGDKTEFIGQNRYGDLKTAVADKVQAFLIEFQTKLTSVDEAALRQKLEASEAQMREVAAQTLYKVQQAVGLRA